MVDCCNAPGLMPFEQAKNTLLNAVTPIKEVELIEIENADHRVLAETITSPINVPAYNNSAMDGYALCDENLINSNGFSEFKLVGVALAGQPFNGELKHGQCIRIMTGAVVPNTANSVVMQENVTTSNDIITLTQPTKLNNNIRFSGEDIKQDQVVFNAGHQIKAVDIGLLASLGLSHVPVLRKVKVAVFSTGDELKRPGQVINPGDIYESNSQVIIAMLKRMALEVIDLGIIADNKQAIKHAFLSANEQADAVISSGGVSVGDADYTKEVLEELGDINFWKVAMKPGKPFAFGQLPSSFFFGLPGNPVSATVTLHQLAKPAIEVLSGIKPKAAIKLNAITQAKINKRPGRMDFQRGYLTITEQGDIHVVPLTAQGSGILSSLSNANCYIILSQDSVGYNAGEQVQVEMFDSVIG